MDLEQKIDRIDTKIDDLTITMTKHIAKDEGLELPQRVYKVEQTIKKKVSWVGLSGALTAFSAVLGFLVILVRGA